MTALDDYRAARSAANDCFKVSIDLITESLELTRKLRDLLPDGLATAEYVALRQRLDFLMPCITASREFYQAACADEDRAYAAYVAERDMAR